MPRLPKITHRRRGFFTFAQNSDRADYLRMAYLLALNLHATQREIPYLTVGITPGTVVPARYARTFDNIVEIPSDDGAIRNEWKAIYLSPYEETIKLDCDMLFFRDISLWWDLMSMQEFHACNRVVDYRGNTISYRKDFETNQLPDIYSAMMYFKKTAGTLELFSLVRDLIEEWSGFGSALLDRPRIATTDMVFALAIKLIDLDCNWYAKNSFPTFVHMDPLSQGWDPDGIDIEWSRNVPVFLRPDLGCKIGNHEQLLPIHYRAKQFVTDKILSYHEQAILRPLD